MVLLENLINSSVYTSTGRDTRSGLYQVSIYSKLKKCTDVYKYKHRVQVGKS